MILPLIRRAGAALGRVHLWRILAIPLLRLSAGGAQPALPPKPEETPPSLESLHVMGSRIKRLDEETIAPVFTLTREEIELSGFQSLGDVIRHLPFSNGTSVDPQFGTGFASEATSLNLRGLGANSALVLVNGRRAAPYGLPGGTGVTTLFDFNSVPLAAIERIEILKDGASALYGADAVSGVVNLRLRAHYSGFAISGLWGNTTDTDSAQQGVSATWGATFGKTNVLVVADWQLRHALFLRDRDFSRSSDGRQFGGQDGRSSTGFPGYVSVPTLDAAGRAPPPGTITNANISPQGRLLANPTVADFSRGVSLFDFNEDTTMLPESRHTGLYARLRHQVNEKVFAFGEFAVRRNETEFVQAASTVVNTSEMGTGPGGNMRLPFNNPYNPFGVDLDNFRFRLVAQGPRVRAVDSATTRYLAGVGGNVGSGDWTWESALLYSRNRVVVDDRNAALDVAVQTLLNQTSRTSALNPFGPSAPGVVESLATTVTRHATVDVQQGDIQANGHLWRLPAGEVGLAWGGEYRRENSRDQPDPRTSALEVVALGGASGLTAARRVVAGYLELSLPLWRTLEAQIAVRHEDYSDFGTATKPKFGVKYRPLKAVLLRGGYSQSFRAPDLAQLFTAQTLTFPSARDPLRPNDPSATVRVIGGGNPALEAERADSAYAGAVVQVPRFPGLELTADLWRFHHRNLIATPTLVALLELETTVPTGRVIRNAPTGDGLPGTINAVSITFRNIAKAETDGIDLAFRYARPTPLGRFALNTAVTYTHSYEFNDVELVKGNGFPMFRGNATVQWSRGAWAASVYANYLDGYAEASAIFGPGKPAAHRINHEYTFTPQISLRWGRGAKVTLGVRDILDRGPPHALSKPEEYDNLQVSGEGRFVFIRLGQEF